MDLAALLHELGLSDSRVGFRCITAAVEIALADPRALTMVTKYLYPQTAQRCKTNWKAVERNIRTSIRIVWSKNPHKLQQLTGCPISSRPPRRTLLPSWSTSSRPPPPNPRKELCRPEEGK